MEGKSEASEKHPLPGLWTQWTTTLEWRLDSRYIDTLAPSGNNICRPSRNTTWIPSNLDSICTWSDHLLLSALVVAEHLITSTFGTKCHLLEELATRVYMPMRPGSLKAPRSDPLNVATLEVVRESLDILSLH